MDCYFASLCIAHIKCLIKLCVTSQFLIDGSVTNVNVLWLVIDEETCITELHADDNGKTLQEVQLINGDKLLLKSSSELLR